MAEYYLETPLSESDVRKLRVGDIVYVSGTMVTARDAAHGRALELARSGRRNEIPIDLEGLVLYHCGPVVKKLNGEWKVVVAGPTTSTRMEKIEGDFIREFKVRGIVGKGGMGDKTAQAMKEVGAFYGAFTGGAAVLAAKAIEKVLDVHWLDLGTPEAVWVLKVDKFGPLVVAIDAQGNNLYKQVMTDVDNNYNTVLKELNLV